VGPIFSIIIPFYNSENTLYNCVNSIIEQKINKYIEIILIDDSSTDNSLKIYNKNFKKIKNIKILKNPKNKGVSYSRNIGLKNSNGRYIVFLDSDDIFLKRKLKKILNLTIKKNSDLLYFNKDLNENFKINSNKELIWNINKLKNFTCHVWNFIIKRNFLLKNKIFFENIKIFEDQPFVTKVLLNAKSAYFINETILHHYEFFSSLSRKTNFISAISCIQVLLKIIKIKIPEKLNENIVKFINSRLYFITNSLKLHLLILNKKQVQILYAKSKFIRFYKPKNKIFKIFNLNNILKYRSVINRKKTTIKQIEFLKKKIYKKYNIYVFSCGIYGRILCVLMKSLNIKIDAFLDNNKNFQKKKYLGINIYNPKILNELNFSQKQRSLVLIGHNNNRIKKEITNQILGFNIKKTNIIKINYI